MRLDRALVDAAAELLHERFGNSGWGAAAAAMYTTTGRMLTSVSVEALLDGANLCIETGAIAVAHKWNEPVTASVCLVRSDSEPPESSRPAGTARSGSVSGARMSRWRSPLTDHRLAAEGAELAPALLGGARSSEPADPRADVLVDLLNRTTYTSMSDLDWEPRPGDRRAGAYCRLDASGRSRVSCRVRKESARVSDRADSRSLSVDRLNG